MKIYLYSKDETRKIFGRSAPSSLEKGMKNYALAFSKKGNYLYLVHNDKMADFSSKEIEEGAFAKYPALKGFETWQFLKIHNCTHKRGVWKIECDFLDVANHAIMYRQKIELAECFEGFDEIADYFESSNNKRFNYKKLAVDKKRQKEMDLQDEKRRLDNIQFTMIIALLSMIMGATVMALFYFAGVVMALRGISMHVRERRVGLKSKAMIKYLITNIIVIALCIAGIVWTIVKSVPAGQ